MWNVSFREKGPFFFYLKIFIDGLCNQPAITTLWVNPFLCGVGFCQAELLRCVVAKCCSPILHVFQENVSCLNTTLVFLMFANKKKLLGKYLQALKVHIFELYYTFLKKQGVCRNVRIMLTICICVSLYANFLHKHVRLYQ